MALVCVRCHVSLTRLGQATCRRSPAVRIQHSVCRLAASTSEGRLPKPMHPMDVSHVGRQGPGRTRRSSRFGRPARRNFPATKMWVQHAVPQDSVHGNMVVQHCVLPLWWLSLRALWFCFLCYLCRVFVREGHCSRPHVFPSWPFVHVGGLAFCSASCRQCGSPVPLPHGEVHQVADQHASTFKVSSSTTPWT